MTIKTKTCRTIIDSNDLATQWTIEQHEDNSEYITLNHVYKGLSNPDHGFHFDKLMAMAIGCALIKAAGEKP